MLHLGFSSRWRNWISLILSSASSAVLLNGAEGPRIRHRRGLRQGDPLSPLLFILAIDPLHRILDRSTQMGYLSPLPLREARLRASLYADDAVVFINPERRDVQHLRLLLQGFGEATGLRINAAKCSVAAIRCEGIDLANTLQPFDVERVEFPIRYLGMPLALGRLRYVDLQHIIDKARSHLAGWSRRWINIGGRRALTISVLSTLPIFALTALKPPPKFIKDLDKIRRNFTWNIEEDEVAGGKCKVNWTKVCSPTDVGGLGLPNLSLFGRALRLRWLWFEWTAPDRPWVGFPNPCDDQDRNLFNATTRVTIGDGKRAVFWHSTWTGSSPLCLQFPDIYKMSRRKNKTVALAVRNNSWVTDLGNRLLPHQLQEFIQLWRLVRHASSSLEDDRPDSIRWILTADGCYSTKSAYNVQFVGRQRSLAPAMIWKVWAPAPCKMLLWLIHQDRVWCADRLMRRGWPNCYFCQLCNRNLETSWHLFFECPFARRIWTSVAQWPGCASVEPIRWEGARSISEAWLIMNATAREEHRKGLRSLFILIAQEIWKERNRRIFENRATNCNAVVTWIRDEARAWAFAGAKALRKLMFEPP
jgi:hypothetical protein